MKSGTRVHVAHGTRDVLGTVLLMDGKPEMAVGEEAWVQIRLDKPLAPRYGDRFIVRSQSATATIGGGEVLDIAPAHRMKLGTSERALLEALLAHDATASVQALLETRTVPLSAAEVAAALGMPVDAVASVLEAAPDAALDVGGETLYLRRARLDELLGEVGSALAAFHRAEPRATGLTIGALRDAVDPRLSARAFDAVLAQAVARGVAIIDKGEVRDPSAASSALAAVDAAADRLDAVLQEQGLAPATLTGLAEETGVDSGTVRRAMTRLAAAGRVLSVGPDLYFAADAVAEARTKLEDHIRAHGPVLAGQVRDLLGTSRKYVVPLLEYFDTHGVTKREGDARVLR